MLFKLYVYIKIYCLKCKTKTETNSTIPSRSKNNRDVVKGVCSVCGKNKSVFVRGTASTGNGFSLNNLINNLPIEFHQFAETGENIPGGSFNDQQKYSYCGPGTRYDQRMKEGYKGINELDSMCKLHDQFYNENTDTKIRNLSDAALAHRADEIAANVNLDAAQRKDAQFLSKIMKTKMILGLGLLPKKSKNFKKSPEMKH